MIFQVGTKALAKMKTALAKAVDYCAGDPLQPPAPNTHLKLLTMADPAIKTQL